MSLRRRARRWRRAFVRLARETTAASLEVADAILAPAPETFHVDVADTTLLDAPLCRPARSRRATNPGSSWHA